MSPTTLSLPASAARSRIGAHWIVFAAALIVAPLVFSSSTALSLLCQVETLMVFALAYNMLLGQGGMLSFGHSVYSGLGAYYTVHAMNAIAENRFALPTTLLPLVGGVAGAFFGILLGYVTTRRAGTVFAMITLGIVELVHAGAAMFPKFFGGDSGITANRVLGQPFMGVTFGPQIQVYYLIAGWLLVCTAAMYAFTQTPLGQMLNATRDNPERVEFVGYNPRRIRYLALIASGFFAGISGALASLNFEIVGIDSLSVVRSGDALLYAFIGGAGYFVGPIVGTIVGVLLMVKLSDVTAAWQFYLGLFFILFVMYAPGGITGLAAEGWRLLRMGASTRMVLVLVPVCISVLAMAAGGVILIEAIYVRAPDGNEGVVNALARSTLQHPQAWFAMALMLLGGGAMAMRVTRARLADLVETLQASPRDAKQR